MSNRSIKRAEYPRSKSPLLPVIRLDGAAAACVAVAVALGHGSPAAAQRTVSWQVGTGPVTTVVDQGAGDLNPAVNFVTAAIAYTDPAGDFSITGTVAGFPFVVPPAGHGFGVNLTGAAIAALRDPGPFIVNSVTVSYTFADAPLSGPVFAGAAARGWYDNPTGPAMRIGFADMASENRLYCDTLAVVADPPWASDPDVFVLFNESQTAYLGSVAAPGIPMVCARIPFILDRGTDTIHLPASAAASLADGPYPTPENTNAYQTGTILAAGPRPPANGDNFFNVEGVNLAAFSAYGVARWDLNQIRTMYDHEFGIGNWHIAEIRLRLTQSNAAFSAAGSINLYYSTDDTTDIKTAASPLHYPFQDYPGVPDLPVNLYEPLATLTYTPTATGAVDEFVIYQLGDQGQRLAMAEDAAHGDGVITLVFEDSSQTPAVAATYRGQAGVPGREPPALYVRPERNTCPLPGCDSGGFDADLNGDCEVDLADLAELLADYGCTFGCSGDVDGNGATDLGDLAILLSRFGRICHP